MLSPEEEQFIELSLGKVRHVRTLEGVKFFDLPMGAPILPGQYEAKIAENATKGIKLPKGAVTKPKRLSPDANYTLNNGKIKRTPLSGPNSFKINNSTFHAPSGARLIRAKNYPDISYVLTNDGELHAFNDQGELDIPEDLVPILKKKFQKIKAGDKDYSVEKFDVKSATKLADQKPGAVLSKDGKPFFTKQDDGSWKGNDLGTIHTDEELQPLFDSGKFELHSGQQNEPDHQDFSSMSKEELHQALDTFPVGKKLAVGNAVLNKKDSDSWESNLTKKSTTTEELAHLFHGTDLLSEKLPEKKSKNGTSRESTEPTKKVWESGVARDFAGTPLEGYTNPRKVSNLEDITKAKPGMGLFIDDKGHHQFWGHQDTSWKNLENDHLGIGAKDFKNALRESPVYLLDPPKNGKNNEEHVNGKPGESNAPGKVGVPEVSGNQGGKSGGGKSDGQPNPNDEGTQPVDSLVVNGQEVKTLAHFDKNSRTADIQKAGGSTPRVFELSPEHADVFRSQMLKSLENNKYAASVYVYDLAEYKGMRLFLADDGQSGVALHGDEIVSVFSTPESKNKKVARHLISVAVDQGGTRLDAFDTVLPKIYAAEGFQVKSRLKWNDEYAPDGWDKKTFGDYNHGEPDVVFMRYNKDSVNGVYTPGSGSYVDTYDQGLASTQDHSIEKKSSVGGKKIVNLPDNTEKIDSVEHFSPGDSVYINVGGTAYHMTLQKDGQWKDDIWGALYSMSEVQSDAKAGNIYAPKLQTIDEMVKSGKPKDMNKSQVQSAIKALEGHSGFQISYGLKSLPANHPLKHKPTLDAALHDAKQSYPDLPPKKALIADLKDTLGVSHKEEPHVEDNSGSKIQIGSRKSKMTQTGETGGQFSKEDVQNAINILENYKGKIFKAELNKHNNPLGKLSPNNIVGFDKDKTVSKQKFIDLLKKKLDAHNNKSIEEKKPATPEYLNKSHDISDVPVAGKVVAADERMTALKNAPVGSVVSRSSKYYPDEVVRYVKNEDGNWRNPDNPDVPFKSDSVAFYNSAMAGKLKWGTPEESKPNSEYKIGDPLDEHYDLNAASVGTIIHAGGGIKGTPYTKEKDGSWDGYSEGVIKNAIVSSNAGGNPWTLQHVPGENKAADTSSGSQFKVGDKVKTKEDLKKVPIGDVVSFQSFKSGPVGLYKHEGPNAWSYPNVSTVITDGSFNGAIENGFLFHGDINRLVKDGGVHPEDNSGPKLGEKITMEQAKALPVGSVINTPSGNKYIKIHDNQWQTIGPDGVMHTGVYGDENLQPFLKVGNGTLHSFGDGTASPTLLRKGMQVEKTAQLDLLPVGSRIIRKSFGKESIYTKDDSGNWVTTLENGEKVRLTSGQLESSVELGKVSVDHVHTGKEEPAGLKHGDVIKDFNTFKSLQPGDKVSVGSTIYTKQNDGTWNSSNGPKGFADSMFHNAVSKGTLDYHKDTLSEEGSLPAQSESDNALDSVIDAHFQQIKAMDKATNILPPEERGANGDGFIVVHTDKGPKITWGKYGGGGVAVLAKDKDGVTKVLVGKRGDRDEWYLPGGAIDEKENHIQGALREFSEEINNGEQLLDQIKVTKTYQALVGKIADSNKDWAYVTSVAEIPSTMDITAPDNIDTWELTEYKWFSPDELSSLDASGKLHAALSNGALAKMVGFEKSDSEDLHASIVSLMKEMGIGNSPDNLAEPKYDISNWKKIGGSQGGTNPGGLYQDELGNKYYVKESNGGELPMHNEVLASALYGAAGVHSNKVFFVTQNGNKLLATPWVENDKNFMENVKAGKQDAKTLDFIKKVQENFAIDAWLDNYDVAGIGPWNLVADQNGDPFRIDPGGALMYRAQGALKSWWGDEPTAIDDMRFGSSQSSAYTYLPKLFGSMTDAEVKQSAKKLLKITPEKISEIVNSTGFDDATKSKLYQTLVTRREKILDRFDLLPKKPDVSYLSKSGLTITPEVANLIIKGNKEDSNKAISLFEQYHGITHNEAKAELIDFALDAIDKGAAGVEKYKKPDVEVIKPAFTKGTQVKLVGTDKPFSVELSTNEASAGIVDGKFLAFLNEELTTDLNHKASPNYAFTSNGQVFDKTETVNVPDPNNPFTTAKAKIVEADPSSGLVQVVHDGKMLEVEKHHITKSEQPSAPKITLPAGYSQPPEGSVGLKTKLHPSGGGSSHLIKHPDGDYQLYIANGWHGKAGDPSLYTSEKGWQPFDPSLQPGNSPQIKPLSEVMDQRLELGFGFKKPPVGSQVVAYNSYHDSFAVQHPDGEFWGYSPDGTRYDLQTDASEFSSPNSQWKPVANPGSFVAGHAEHVGTPEPVLVGPKDSKGRVIKKGDSITIIKHNKGGFSAKAKIVSINEEKGTARVRRLDENGVPLTDENGKPVYANIALSNLRKEDFSRQSNGLPTGVTMSEGDKSSPLYGKPKPEAPVATPVLGSENANPIVDADWLKNAEEAYKAYRESKNFIPKALKDSATAWGPIEKAMKGDESSLEHIKNKGYLDSNPSLYEDLQKAIDLQKSKYASVIAEHEKQVAEYQTQYAAWMKANGIASYTPLRHEDVMNNFDDNSAHEWLKKRFKNVKLSSNAKNALETQKGNSYWQWILRRMPFNLGVTNKHSEDFLNSPQFQPYLKDTAAKSQSSSKSSALTYPASSSINTLKGMQEMADIAGPLGESMRAVRTVEYDLFVGADGKRLSSGDDLTQLIGSIQKDHGSMEVNPNSITQDYSKVNDFYPVLLDLAIPAEAKGFYTGISGYSHSGEHGFIMEPGQALYIWDAKQEYVKQTHDTRWVVKASIIPKDVFPYMNDFEGSPKNHNIFIPGKDTTTGVPDTPPSTPDVKKPEVSDFVPPEPGKWSIESLDNAPVGTTAVDNTGREWIKLDSGQWTTTSGHLLYRTSEHLAKDYMDDVWMDLIMGGNQDNSVPTGLSTPAGSWSHDDLINAGIGTLAVDAQGDTWKKIEPNLWKIVHGQHPSNIGLSSPTKNVNKYMYEPMSWNTAKLNNLPQYAVIKDASGDRWQKVGDHKWQALSGSLMGEIVETSEVTKYMKQS